MKTLDTKSLLMGVGAAFLVVMLTSGKPTNSENNLHVFSRGSFLEIYNPNTNTLFEYKAGLGSRTQDGEAATIYKIAADGSTVIKQ